MATPRTQQTHEKRVQKIVEEAADAISADSPVEEEVVVTVEELPPGQSGSRASGSSARAEAAAEEATRTMFTSAARGQQLAANGINAWVDFTRNAFGTGQMADLMDPKAIVENGFRFAEELLDLQKDFALRLVDALPGPR